MNERELIERSVQLLQRSDASVRDESNRAAPKTLGQWLQNPEFLVEPPSLIPWIALSGRSTLLAAREKTGKSTLLAQAVAALTTGGSFLKRDLNRTIVLWYCLDEPIADCVRRFERLGGDPDSLVISTERPTAVEMRAEADAAGAYLVVVDTLTELWRGMIRSEKDADDVAGFLDPYIRLLRESNISLIFSHHTPKSGNDYRGSGAIGAKVDVILLLRRPSTASRAEDSNETDGEAEIDDGQRILEGRGRGLPHFIHRLSFAEQTYSLGEAALSLRDRILAALSAGGDTTRGIRERVRGKSQRISDTLAQLDHEGAIQKAGRLWVLAEAGSQPELPSGSEPSVHSQLGSLISAGTAQDPNGNTSGTTSNHHQSLTVPVGRISTETQEPPSVRSQKELDGTAYETGAA
jgi:hypothetical protein